MSHKDVQEKSATREMVIGTIAMTNAFFLFVLAFPLQHYGKCLFCSVGNQVSKYRARGWPRETQLTASPFATRLFSAPTDLGT
jgi:hypothetical protein